MSVHPARTITFDELHSGLEAARAAGMVVRKFDRETGRALYVYSNACVYDDGWDEFSLMARGLILHPDERRIIATPFPKFFNAGERRGDIPTLPFETFEKVDGSLAIIHHHGGRWRAATKGAFDSAQAVTTEAMLASLDTSALVPGTTYLAELVGPDNRIVVRYHTAALVLLAAYDEAGTEVPLDALREVGDGLGWRTARRHSYSSFAELIADAKSLPPTHEGFVIRFSDGLRLKLKGDEYRRIHALVSRCTPLALWESIVAGDDLDAMRRDIPEEFWADFDTIIRILKQKAVDYESRIVQSVAAVAHLSDKELGLSGESISEELRPFLFAYRKQGAIVGKTRDTLWRLLRPKGNILEGYEPSSGLQRVADEAV